MFNIHWKKILKNLFSLLLTLIILSQLLDFIRRPNISPHLTNQVLYDLEQQPFFLAQLSQQRPVILYFWGSWCGYCRYTSPAVEKLYQENIPVVSIALQSGSPEQVKNYLAEHQYHFPTVNDHNGELAKQWDISVTPSILIIKQGKLYTATTGLTSYWGIKARWLMANL